MGGAITYQEDTTMQAVIYLRTGNQGQTLDMAIDMQRDSTHNLIAQRGWTIAGEYVDAGVPARPDVPRPGAAH
jgi:DNA invertase Pin-like site-specific DNA recombinase